MKRLLGIAAHVAGIASIATLFFATLFVGTLSNMARVAVTARAYHPAHFVVQRLASSSGFHRGDSPGCWAVGLVGQSQERLSLMDCDWTTNRAIKPEVAVGQTVSVVFSPSATHAQIQGEFLRVLYPDSVRGRKQAAWTYARKIYEPSLLALSLLSLLTFVGRLAYGPGATTGMAYGAFCLALLGFHLVGFAAMQLL